MLKKQFLIIPFGYTILCLTMAINVHAQRDILNISSELLGESRSEKFNDGVCIFKVSTPDVTTTTRLANDLRLTADLDNLGNQSAWIKPTVTNNTLSFSLCDFLSGKTEAVLVILNKGTEMSRLSLQKEQANGTQDEAISIVQLPQIDILSGISYQTTQTFTAGSNTSTSNLTKLLYSLCDNKIYWHSKKKPRPRVGESFEFSLSPVPNHYRYEIELSSKYVDYNTEADDLLEKNLLGAWKNQVSAQSSADNAKKSLALSYLREINKQLSTFLNFYYDLECVDVAAFRNNKKQVLSNIENVLKGQSNFSTTGDYEDFLRTYFTAKDSNVVRPYLETFRKFASMDFRPVRYLIPRLQNFDELQIKMKIKPNKERGSYTFSDSIVTQSLYGGFKVDVSPGIFYSSLGGTSYSLRADSTLVTGSNGADSVTGRDREIIKESGNRGNLVFGTLMHFYSRWGQHVNLAASIGVGMTLDESPDVQYLGGLSLLFGRVNRISISGGIAVGKVKRISDRYLDGAGFRRVNFNETELSTKKLLKSGWFLGIGYNIPLVKRKSSTEEAKK